MKLVERTINKDIVDSINKFIEEIKKNIMLQQLYYLALMQKKQKMKIAIKILQLFQMNLKIFMSVWQF